MTGRLLGMRPPGEVGDGGPIRSAVEVCQDMPADVDVWVIVAAAAAVLLICCALGWAKETVALAAERRAVARLEAANTELRRQVIRVRSQLVAVQLGRERQP